MIKVKPKRILLVAPDYVGLHLPILKELEKQGHDVYYIEDKWLSTDCRFRHTNKYIKRAKGLYNKWFRIYERYSNDLFKKHEELSKPFDCLFCIQGYSVSRFFINRLKNINPDIRCILYIWDSNKFYDFFCNVPLFDKSYTFDYKDCIEGKKVKFLPFYWQNTEEKPEVEYDISCIGTDHDGRFRFMERILPELKAKGLSYNIKIRPISIPKGFLYWKMSLFDRKNLSRIKKDHYDCLKSDICLIQTLPSEEVELITSKSRIILDTDRETQTGTTPRVIWALAHNKRIISTNTYLKELPFYNREQILIVNRDNPVIDTNFINSEKVFMLHPIIASLRIDKWVQRILS